MTKRQYRLVIENVPGYWVNVDSPTVSIETHVDRIEFRDAPAPCKAKAPAQVDYEDLVCCGEVNGCLARGYHLVDVEVTVNYWDDCHHEVTITWPVVPDGE